MNLVVETRRHSPTPPQRAWLRRGLDQPGGKLPLFDKFGQHIDPRTVRACIEQGWAEPWYCNPLKPDWMVCKLTIRGRTIAARPLLHASYELSER
ncbi:MAG TPA: hypothetical protein VGL83_20870 [Stellaceae bacterium]|jgi:hypothetical protein